MKLPNYQWLSQMAAASAVVVSLGLVAYELKQSRDLAEAEIYQQRTGQWLDIILSRYSAEQYRDAMNRVRFDPKSVTREDEGVLRDAMYARFTFYENIHFQYQLGLLSGEEWEATLVSLAEDVSLPCFDFWDESERKYWRKSFAIDVDSLKAKHKAVDCETYMALQQ
jgi:hypothetical protein